MRSQFKKWQFKDCQYYAFYIAPAYFTRWNHLDIISFIQAFNIEMQVYWQNFLFYGQLSDTQLTNAYKILNMHTFINQSSS